MNQQGTADHFIRDTEHAVRHFFEGLKHYDELLDGLTPPSQASSVTQVNQYVAQAGRYFALSTSRAALCGAVLETAYVAINAFPQNSVVPSSCTSFVRSTDRAVRFCIGREIHGLPLGLFIYAGRNQHVHWEDESFDGPTTAVFDALGRAYQSNILFDMAYVLNWPKRSSKAHHIVQNELRWRDYDDYATDLRVLVGATAG